VKSTNYEALHHAISLFRHYFLSLKVEIFFLSALFLHILNLSSFHKVREQVSTHIKQSKNRLTH